MESVIVALVCIAIILFGGMMIAQGSFSSLDLISNSWKEMEVRATEIARTKIASLTSANVTPTGDVWEITLENEGEMKLGDFPKWDVIVQYYLAAGDYIIKWLPYTEAPLEDNQWTVVGIYLDAQAGTPEVFEPGILNPGEEMVIRLKVVPLVGLDTTNLATISTPNGITTSIVFTW